jgi:hypothetical protein
VKLQVLAQPLKEPGEKGRVVFDQKAVPLTGNDPSILMVCGSCETTLVKGQDPKSLRTVFNGAEIFIKCSKCGSFNDATPEPPGPYDLDNGLLDHIKSLMSHSTKARNELFNKFQHLGLTDPRIGVADHLVGVSSATFLTIINAKENIRYEEWWKSHGFEQAVKAGIVPSLLSTYETLTISSLMFFSFSLFENGLRRVVRFIDSNACNNGASEFKSIYEWLFARLRKEGWAYSSGDPSQFLDLFRTFRNTLHNNGAFFPTNGKNQEIEWQGRKYQFEVGKTPSFYGWEFFLMLLYEINSLNLSIMSSKMISSLTKIS